MARCNDCNKFASLEFQDPEVESLEVSEDGTITCNVRIARACADCGSDLKEATFEMEEQFDAEDEGHVNAEGEDKHDLHIEETSCNQIEEGGGRYAKSYFGAEVSFTVTCKCDEALKDKRWSHEGTLSDKVAASAMDEC